ncbi:hypothetical protein PG994_014045 [Apiospora phragmitis]|uniref:Amino acid permease n=1 Tax=Apiospora phragmitis TaxID=2905665 RepID=A0ABR1T374_9PEZI
MDRSEKKASVGTNEAEMRASPSQSVNTSEENLAILQTRTRRLFNKWQLFALSLMYMSTWSAVPGNMYYAMYNGGPAAYVASYIIIGVGALCQTASFGELASIQPIAGTQYYWTYHFAPARSRRFLAWLQGWVTWTGYVATFASSLNFGTPVLEGLIQLNYPDYVVEGWRTTLISLCTLAAITLVNLYAFRAVPWFDLFSGVLNILLFVAFMIIFLVMAPKNSGDIFTQTSVSSGWQSYYAASQIGSLSNVWLTAFLVALLTLLNLGSEMYIALGAITSLSTMAMYMSYAVVFAVVLYARSSAPKGIELGPWNLGRWGRAINVVALVYTVYVIIWLPFPQTTPVNASTMNYSGPVLGVVLVLTVALWVFRRNRWEGPNRAVVDIALKAED